ncbi:DeoR/GlpR transcriptional regulator [Jejubacter calystegiae]|uniref:DeoR/GlpR transcriptional regulator n=1 Tax=Jejubacter calystegiae TaxID=2579935 RepID=A0A4P8YLA8_9ENTR|nr:DNA-binding transcriptional regulator YciT [Jejubacter calystegiae]QCT21570.1 DeoR/GlpR transcriptional regulator [Jejubacter calystegiae]
MNARQQQILQMVVERGRMNVSDLSRITGVSEVTIRQDLNLLEKQNYLRRAHGYAMPLESDDVETRMMNNFPVKQRLAEYAASLVKDGETIFIENGSSNALLARALGHNRRLTLITASSHIAWLLRESECEVILVGGSYQKKSETMVGPLARAFIRQINFTKAFIGIDGWQPDTGFTGKDMLRSDLVSAVLDKESETIVLSDSSKFSVTWPWPLDAQHKFRRVITDNALDRRTVQQLEESGLKVDLVDCRDGAS